MSDLLEEGRILAGIKVKTMAACLGEEGK